MSHASRFGRILGVAVFLLVALDGEGAHAQSTGDVDQARALAKAGWKALDEERYADALAKISQAEALYHAPTHLLLMGSAQVGLGKLSDALATFEKLAAEPLPAKAPRAFAEAHQTAEKRIKELRLRVPSLAVEVENVTSPEPTFLVDGAAVRFPKGAAVRMNPGTHVVRITADGFLPKEQTVTLPEKAEVVRLVISLQKEVAIGPKEAGTDKSSAKLKAMMAPGAMGTKEPAPGASLRIPMFTAFGAAGLGAISGAVTGGLSLSMTAGLKDACPGGVCPQDQRDALESANTLANVSTASFAVCGAAAAVGIVLWALDPGRAKQSQSARGVSIDGAGVSGRF